MTENTGVLACNKTLVRLINRAASRIFNSGNLRFSEEHPKISLPATESSLPEYYNLERFAHREDYHARLQTFIKAGAVSVVWDRNAGERGQLSRISLENPHKLAEILDVDLPWVTTKNAIYNLANASNIYNPHVKTIIDAWSRGKAPGGIAAEQSNLFVDALKVIEASRMLNTGNKDVMLRRLSIQLFGDSKRIESLRHPLTFLLNGELESEEDDIFTELGLVKHPQPMLLSGSSVVSVHTEKQHVPLVRPYIGLRPDKILSLNCSKDRIKSVITIENLASFNEAAEHSHNPEELLIIYVAGNPTPAFLGAYRRVLESIEPELVQHWGDIDLGGFRIAAKLARIAMEAGCKLTLLNMNPAKSVIGGQPKALKHKVEKVVAICNQHGWGEEALAFESSPFFQEQEIVIWS